MLVIDKPGSPTNLPPLPPFLRGKPRPERGVYIIPDIIRIEQSQEIMDHQNNWITTIYSWMNRVHGNILFDDNFKLEIAHAHSRTYRQWLETYETKNGVPPHISFSGCIKSGQHDPSFYTRWTEWARETFG
jgi:hypothetical protein